MRSLAPFYPQKRDLAQPVGEAWLTARQCRITTGEFSGRDLQAAWCELPPEARGAGPSAAQDLPLLVKLIFPADKLSIQVHPDDGYASSHEGPGAQGKTEMWHVLAAEHGATLLLGLKPGTTDHAFRAALEAQNLEELFEKRSVQEGDTFFVPAGAPHTIGAGMVLCEIQQYSDLTYRVYDYGRLDASGAPRELHVEKALEVMRYGPSRAGKVKPLARAAGFSLLAASRYFAAERWEFPHPGEIPLSAGHFDLLVIGAGSGHFEWPDGEGAYKSGEAWFVPAGDAAFRVLPDEHTAVIRAYVPDLARLRAELRHEGFSESKIAQVVFD